MFRDRTVPVGQASLPAAIFMSATVKGCRYSTGNGGAARYPVVIRYPTG
jgi:hypothetical protein